MGFQAAKTYQFCMDGTSYFDMPCEGEKVTVIILIRFLKLIYESSSKIKVYISDF